MSQPLPKEDTCNSAADRIVSVEEMGIKIRLMDKKISLLREKLTVDIFLSSDSSGFQMEFWNSASVISKLLDAQTAE